MLSFSEEVARIQKLFMIAMLALAMLYASSLGEYNPKSVDSGHQWKFAVLCDTRGNNTDVMNKSGINDTFIGILAQEIVRQDCDLVLVPGDMINGYFKNGSTSFSKQFSNWRAAMKPVYDAGIEVYPVRGNHENGMEYPDLPWPPVYPPPSLPKTEPGIIEAYRKAFNDSYIPENGPNGERGLTYSFVHKNAFFVGLDEYIHPHMINLAWLEDPLSSNEMPHIFVFGHDPAFKMGHNDSLAYYPDERDIFWDALGKAGGKIYFCGHDHLYDRAHINDSMGDCIYQLIVGSGGAPMLRSSRPYAEGDRVVGDYRDYKHAGYMLVTISENQVKVDWMALDNSNWKALDSFAYEV